MRAQLSTSVRQAQTNPMHNENPREDFNTEACGMGACEHIIRLVPAGLAIQARRVSDRITFE